MEWSDALDMKPESPWFQWDTIEDEDILREYADPEGWLPGNILFEVKKSL